MKKKLFYTLLLLTIAQFSVAQVVINEFSASNLEGHLDAFGRTEDWIELYNASDSPVDISGWHLSDKVSKEKKWEIPEGLIIPARGYQLFYCSGRDGVFANEYHTNYKLAQTKDNEVVQLADADGNVLESYPLPLTLVEHSICRTTDGADEWMICSSPTYGTSNDSSPQFDRYTATPTIELEAGFYDGTQTVTIVNNEPNSVLRYTTNGHNPTNSSSVYNGPITINETTVIKAQAFSNNNRVRPGKMDFSTFFIDEDFSLVVFSVAADEVIDLANGQGELIPIGSLEYFNLDKEREAVGFGSLNRHGQDSWVLDHRSLDWITRDEMGYEKAINAKLFGYSERDEYQKFMFRNSGDDNYPAIDDGQHDGATHIRDEYVQTLGMEGGMKLDQRAVERVIVFLNGQYWGVYGMRERAVDHDYTDEYYNQGKYEIQYLSTWNTTEIEYGGQRAADDWANLRDFILEEDMSLDENYTIAEDSLNMLSLIDYMLLNLNVVASDWLNYNTGWWRGLNEDGDHKKWGYIMWDLDATFDYYINYTGVPNISPSAQPCDIEEIASFVDDFFSGYGGYGSEIENPAECTTIIDGTSPYPATDLNFIATINQDNFCCNVNWDETCQSIYDNFEANGGGTTIDPTMCATILNGSAPYEPTDLAFIQTINSVPQCCDSEWSQLCEEFYQFFNTNGGGFGENEISGNFGQHEKIFLKLLDESPTFKELYYQRYADLMNTTFSCDNMITTLDSMLAVIVPEMPRQIERWGGTMEEWELNVDTLKMFINERCQLLDDGALGCYDDLDGPYDITLMAEPDGIGEIDFNTLDIESFPWSGSYFGGVNNKIKAKVFNDYEDDYEFSHWESRSGNTIFPDASSRKANIMLTEQDTLIAVFKEKGTVSTVDFNNNFALRAYPNPAVDKLIVEFSLDEASEVYLELYSMVGQRITDFPEARVSGISGDQKMTISLDDDKIVTGLYNLVLNVGDAKRGIKVNIVK